MERLKENAYNILYIYIPMWMNFYYHTRKERICQQKVCILYWRKNVDLNRELRYNEGKIKTR